MLLQLCFLPFAFLVIFGFSKNRFFVVFFLWLSGDCYFKEYVWPD